MAPVGGKFTFISLSFSSKKKHARFPPGPPNLPLVGSLPFLGKDIREPLRKLINKYVSVIIFINVFVHRWVNKVIFKVNNSVGVSHFVYDFEMQRCLWRNCIARGCALYGNPSVNRPTDRMTDLLTDRHSWKHCLPATLLVDGKHLKISFMDRVLNGHSSLPVNYLLMAFGGKSCTEITTLAHYELDLCWPNRMKLVFHILVFRYM